MRDIGHLVNLSTVHLSEHGPAPEKLVHSLDLAHLVHLSRITAENSLPLHWAAITLVLKGQDDLPQGVSMDRAPVIELTSRNRPSSSLRYVRSVSAFLIWLRGVGMYRKVCNPLERRDGYHRLPMKLIFASIYLALCPE